MMEKNLETTITENQMERKMENDLEIRECVGLYRGYIGIIEKIMETTILF